MAQAIPYIAANWQGIAAGASAAAAAGGTAASIHQSRKATRAQEKADKASRAAAEIQNQRSIRQQILQARRAQAQTIAAGGAATGSLGGNSAVQGGVASIGTQGASNIGFGNTQIGANNAILNQTTQARRAASNAATFGAIAKLPGQFGWDPRSSIRQIVDQSDVNDRG